MSKATRNRHHREDIGSQPAQVHAREGAGLHLHTRTVHPALTIPYLTRDDVTTTAKAATSRMPGGPATKDLLFYGGLGAMAVAGALEWPVALAVGGATYLLRSGRTHEANAGVPTVRGGGVHDPDRRML